MGLMVLGSDQQWLLASQKERQPYIKYPLMEGYNNKYAIVRPKKLKTNLRFISLTTNV